MTLSSSYPQGGIRFQISVSIDWSEFENWTPDRITAFMDGIAKVMAAKQPEAHENAAMERIRGRGEMNSNRSCTT